MVRVPGFSAAPSTLCSPPPRRLGRLIFLILVFLLAACGGTGAISTSGTLAAEGKSYPTCRQLHISVPNVQPGPHDSLPSVEAIAKAKMSGRTIVAVESDGPAACGASQWPNTQGSVIFVFLSPSMSSRQRQTLEKEEVSYLTQTKFFRVIRTHVTPADVAAEEEGGRDRHRCRDRR